MEPRKFIQSKIKKVESGCWIWQGCVDNQGYGYFNDRYREWNGSRTIVAHRFSYEVYKLAEECVPEGYVVCHECDQPQCVNPYHLFLGTASINMKDMHDKGRAAHHTTPKKIKVAKTGFRLLSADERAEVRRERKIYGTSFTELARKFKTSIEEIKVNLKGLE